MLFSWLKRRRKAISRRKLLSHASSSVSVPELTSESEFEPWQEKIRHFFIAPSFSDRLIQHAKSALATQRLIHAQDIAMWIQKTHPPVCANLNQWLADKPLVIFLLGVNGAGKTTTIAKLIHALTHTHAIPTSRIGAIGTDTFRAAAMAQLEKRIHGLGVQAYIPHDIKKPSTVLYQGLTSFLPSGKKDVILIDTSGRLHTDKNLMRELDSLITHGKNWAREHTSHSQIKTLLICDGTHGHSLESQIQTFHSHLTLDGVMFTKYDCLSEKGPLIATVATTQVPLFGLGMGEADQDLWRPSPSEFIYQALGCVSATKV